MPFMIKIQLTVLDIEDLEAAVNAAVQSLVEKGATVNGSAAQFELEGEFREIGHLYILNNLLAERWSNGELLGGDDGEAGPATASYSGFTDYAGG